MKYQLGDIVLILHSNEEGKIVDIINDKMLMIEVEGVSFPVYMDQVDFPYFKRFSEKKLFPTKTEKTYIDDVRKEKPVKEKKVSDGVWLSFLPVMDVDEFGDEIVEELKIYILNRTDTAYHFTYKLHFFGKPDFELKNTVHPFQDFYVHDVPFEDLSDSPTFELDFSLVTADKKKSDHFETSVKLKPKQLFTRIEKLKEKNEATFTQLLFETYPDKLITEDPGFEKLAAKGYKIYDASKARQHLEPARSVIDLHIERLTDNWRHMSSFEILTLQLKTFEKFYELALAHLQPSLIVVHGVGEGVLRNEVHDILRLKKEVKSFVNQYHPSFGFGATEIFFQYG